MSKHHHDPAADLYEDVLARQRNTTWPDAKVNARGVDDLLWNGSTNPTKVQRVGIAIVGISYMIAGAGLMIVASELHSRLAGAVALLPLSLGAKVLFNAFFKRAAKPRNRQPHRLPSNPQ